jgi:hypothetical protein
MGRSWPSWSIQPRRDAAAVCRRRVQDNIPGRVVGARRLAQVSQELEPAAEHRPQDVRQRVVLPLRLVHGNAGQRGELTGQVGPLRTDVQREHPGLVLRRQQIIQRERPQRHPLFTQGNLLGQAVSRNIQSSGVGRVQHRSL